MSTSLIFEITQVAFYSLLLLGHVGVYFFYGRTTVTFRTIAFACAFAVAADSILLAVRSDSSNGSTWYQSAYVILAGLSQLIFNSVAFTLFRSWLLSMNNILPDSQAGMAMRLGNVLYVLTAVCIIGMMIVLQLVPDMLSMNTGAIIVWVLTGVYVAGEVILAIFCVWLMLHAGVDYTITPEFERKRKQLAQLVVFCIASAPPVILLYPAGFWNYPLTTNGWQSATTAVYLGFVGHVIYWMLAVYWLFPRVLEGYKAGPRGFRSKTVNMRPGSIVVRGSKEDFLTVKHPTQI